MIKFLTKGLLRDRTRSFFPVLVITISVAIVVFASGFMAGTMNSLLLDTAVILSGHEKIVTRAYHEESMLMPNDLALLDAEINSKTEFKIYNWKIVSLIKDPEPIRCVGIKKQGDILFLHFFKNNINLPFPVILSTK